MEITPQNGLMGATVEGFDLARASGQDYRDLKQAMYRHKVLVLTEQHLSSAEFIRLGRALGTVEVYYEPMYHHPEHQEIFVSATAPEEGEQVGVPKTGTFWHADYSFMPKPFGITMVYPQVVPEKNRCTYFIDMGRAFRALPGDLRAVATYADVEHSPRRYFKIRPSDVYRPIHELQDEIEKRTPAVVHPATFTHPVTGEEVLYLNEGFACELRHPNGTVLGHDILDRLLEESGQLDTTFTHPHIHPQRFGEGDLLIWDNRSLVHRSPHPTPPEPAVSYRVTVHDEFPFYEALSP